MKKLPIPNSTEIEKARIEEIVTRILAAKRGSPQADTTDLERQIDFLVYELYGLTEEEVAIVEGK